MVDQLVTTMQEQLNKMCSTGKLFRAAITGDEIYQLYLKSFPEGRDPVFRDPNSTYHNCNNCKNFIRRYGNIVSIAEDGSLITLFGGDNVKEEYAIVATKLNDAIKSKVILSVFFEDYDMLDRKLNYERCNKKQETFRLGIHENHKQYNKEKAEKFPGVVKEGEIRRFTHMHVNLPKQFVIMTGKSVESMIGEYRDKYEVFKRAMTEISLDTLSLVEDLINQGSLLDGPAHLPAIKVAMAQKKEWDKTPVEKRDNLAWIATYGMSERNAKFRNTLIGVLCVELSQGEEINKACENWNRRVDPVNYHKATAPITKKQIAEAQKFVEENGYMESFDRRLASIDDIHVEEIKYIGNGDGKIPNVTMFDKVKATATQHKRAQFEGIEEMPIEKFMTEVMPKCSGIEAFLLNSHEGNLVTMTTSSNNAGKPIFKWPNNYSWDFNGNLAGKSQIKDAVKERGGNITGALRFSIMWGEGDPSDNSDLDAHAQEPQSAHGEHIYYSTSFRKDRGNMRTRMSGQLDVDITQPNSFGNKNIVENIVWTDKSKMGEGVYKVWVHQFSARGSKGFRAEVEFDGEIYQYEYNQPVSGNVQVAEITLKGGVFSIKHILPESASNKELWGLETNNFHKVNLVCLSPNHWSGNAVGNKHYFFMLEGCKTEKNVRAFHNENLLPDLLKHRKVMEVLGATHTIKPEPNQKQLAGLGFNATVRDEVILKIKGSHQRVVKVKF